MLIDIETQKQLIDNLELEIGALADYLFPDNDKHVNSTFDRIEQIIHHLRDSYKDPNTYIKLIERDTGDVVMKYFEKGDIGALCYKASQIYAWSDCDYTYQIEEIMCDGEPLFYKGWQPGMLFEFYDLNGTIVYSAEFMEWDH